MKDESQQQVPPGIVAFKKGEYIHTAPFDKNEYNFWVGLNLSDGYTIHAISVDNKEYSVGEKSNKAGDRITSFEYDYGWMANTSIGYRVPVKYLCKFPPPSQQDRSVSQPGKEDTPEELAEKFIEHTDITDRKECWLAGYHFAQESQPSQPGEGKEAERKHYFDVMDAVPVHHMLFYCKQFDVKEDSPSQLAQGKEEEHLVDVVAAWIKSDVDIVSFIQPSKAYWLAKKIVGFVLSQTPFAALNLPKEPSYGGKEVTILDLVEEKRELQWRIVDLKATAASQETTIAIRNQDILELKEEISALKSNPTNEESEKAYGAFVDRMKMAATLKNTWYAAIQWYKQPK